MHEIRLQSVDSTQMYAKAHAAKLPKEGITCIIAEEQTAGRGRFGRHWTSPKGVNLYATFYFHLPLKSKDVISLAQLMACSAVRVLKKAKIKWPNDLQLGGKKLGGILCETVFGKEVEVFLGIGLNVNMEWDDLAKIDQPATSLKIETRKDWDREELLRQLQRQFVSDLDLFKKEGFAPFHDFLEQHLVHKGEEIRCFDGKKEWVGILHSITLDGQLNLLLENGTIHRVVSGEILN